MQLKIKGILSYPHLNTPRAVTEGDDPKFSCSVLLPANDPQIAGIQQAIETEKLNGFPSGFPTTGKVCLKPSPDIPGYMIISASAKVDQKPALVDVGLQPIIDPSLVYAGALAWVSLNTFSYSMPTSKGISAGLNGVMLTGEEGALGRLDGRPTVEGMFGDVPVAALPVAAPPVAAPPVAAPPVAAPPVAALPVAALPVAALPVAAPPVAAPPVAAPPVAAPPVAALPVAALPVAALLPTELCTSTGQTLANLTANGWSDQQIIDNGYGIRPSFA